MELSSDHLLERLAAALDDEHHALLERDVARLARASEAKQEALHALESHPPVGQDARLDELLEANRINGALLAQRRRDLQATLRRLTQHASAPGYDAHGRRYSWHNRHSLAMA